jgi:tetratricopeptide (TPR) repeat protein
MMRALRRAAVLLLLIVATCFGKWTARAADYVDAEALYFAGKYDECLSAAAQEVQRGVFNDRWPQLLIRCQLTLGRYPEAQATFEAALRRHSRSLPLRLLGYDVYRFNNNPRAAEQELGRIFQMVQDAPWRFASKENLVALGRCFVLLGADARQVLELYYDRVKEAEPEFVETYVATAELAIAKHDYQVAAQALERAAELRPDDPDIHWLRAVSWQESDSERATAAIAKALELNGRHVPSLLMLAEQRIDAEDYGGAAAILTRVLEINLLQADAWSLHAAIAHLEGHYEGEGLLRKAALTAWQTNPQVDHLIGRKLSQNYRFREGAAYQRKALEMDADFAPATFQLAQDLLRLGEDGEGWDLTNKVYEADKYNTVAHNLMTLHDRLLEYSVLRRGNLVVRMERREALVYGDAVLDLLEEAWKTLCAKYEVTLDEPVFVEIFPRQEDFAIRTFGLPGGEGFLGVCFGRVITANSPAAQGESPSNWQSVLWHEFCHVVTLEKTNNKMPRWLSEGISVYEERLKNPSWGQSMTPQYRQMILGEEWDRETVGPSDSGTADPSEVVTVDGPTVPPFHGPTVLLTPVSELSSAFLRPPSPAHLQFAYFEASMVVEYLVEKHGIATLNRILEDLGMGLTINETLQRHAGSLAQLDEEFAVYARARARDLGDGVDWNREGLPDQADAATWKEWVEKAPNNYWALRQLGAMLVRDQEWDDARRTLEKLHELYPNDTSSGNALELLALVYRGLDDLPAERKVLDQLAALDCDSMDVYRRLMELAAEEEDWVAVAENARRMLAVNPLLPVGHEMLARAAAELGQPCEATRPLAALAEMDPIDPADVHFRLAKAYYELGQRDQARREVLKALEEAPRYRDAQKLLLELE